MKRHTSLKRKTSLKRRKPLSRSSTKRKAELRRYCELKREFWRTHRHCEICFVPIFQEPPHHTKGTIGPLFLAVETWMAVCKACHRRIHDHGKWAREQGYITK
jgi:hypothetical protein